MLKKCVLVILIIIAIVLLRREVPLDRTIGSESIEELLQTVERASIEYDAASYLSLIYWPDIPQEVRRLVIEAESRKMHVLFGEIDPRPNIDITCKTEVADKQIPPPYERRCSTGNPMPAKYGSLAFYKMQCVSKNPNPVQLHDKWATTYGPIQFDEYITLVNGRYYIAPSYPTPSRHQECWIALQE
jgi:hypothetical protein